MQRVQKDKIIQDLAKKMVFIVGPRQAGKSWLAKDIAQGFQRTAYLSYDAIEDRRIIKAKNWLSSTELLIFR